MEISTIQSVIGLAIFASASVLYATLGGIIAERAGIVTLGIEGVLMVSAVVATGASVATQSPFVGVVAGAVAGAVMGLIQAIGCITLKSDHVVIGFAIFIFGDGFAKVLGTKLGPGGGTLVGVSVPKLDKLDLILFDLDPLVILLIPMIIAMWLYFFRTKPGLIHRAVGEDPYAADIQGVNVIALQYAATIIGCGVIGIGGAHLALSFGSGWNNSLSNGRGWIAVAMIIFSNWNPLYAAIGTLLYGTTVALQFRLQLAGVDVSTYVLKAMPYIVTLVAVTVLSQKRNGAPRALGVVFKRG